VQEVLELFATALGQQMSLHPFRQCRCVGGVRPQHVRDDCCAVGETDYRSPVCGCARSEQGGRAAQPAVTHVAATATTAAATFAAVIVGRAVACKGSGVAEEDRSKAR
jgi:hypothetical protein